MLNENLNGQTFNYLTVIEFAKRYKSENYWKCLCQCGNIKIVNEYELKSGRIKACGCLRYNHDDYTGQRFGRLLVLHKDNKKNNFINWICQCDCGKIISIRQNELKHQKRVSCGCFANLSKRKYNKYDLSGGYGIGWTTNTNKEFYFDLEDYEKIKIYCWREDKRGYIATSIYQGNKQEVLLLHRLIMGLHDKSLIVDHIFHKLNDNRKSELRITTQANNTKNHKIQKNNALGITGVYYDKKIRKYKAYIICDKHYYNLGCFNNIENAATARKEAEQKYFGEYAYEST